MGGINISIWNYKEIVEIEFESLYIIQVFTLTYFGISF